MALEVQINSTNAQQALNAIERGINAVIARMDALASAPGVDTFSAKLSQLRGINPAVISSFSTLEGSISRLSTSAGALSRITSSLEALARTDISRVTQNVQALNTALSQLAVPPTGALTRFATAITKIGDAANTAAQSVVRLGAAINGINVAPIQQAGAGVAGFGRQTQQASSNLGAFNAIGNYTSGMLLAMGVSFAASGIVNFIQDAYKASVTMDQFMVSMRFATGSNEKAAESFKYLREVARQTGQPIDALIPSFRKFEQAAVSAGYSVDQSQQVFTKFSAVFRAFGLTSEQTKRSFTALEQMMAKGTISMEELRQQLGENVPAFSQLALATGKSEAELAKLISQGKISASTIGLLADQMFNAVQKTGAFAEALKQPQARLATWQSQLFEFQVGFGNNFIKPVLDGLDNLSKAFGGQENMIKFGQTLGWLAGQSIKILIDGIATLVSGLRMLYSWANDVVTGFQLLYAAGVALGQTLVQVFQDIGQGIANVWNGITSFDFSQIQLGINQLSGSVTDLGGKMQSNFNTMRDSVLGAKKAVDSNNGSLSAAERATRDLNTPVGELTKSTNSLTSSTNSTASALYGAANAANTAASAYGNASKAAAGLSSGADVTARLQQRSENEYQKRIEYLNTPIVKYDPNAPVQLPSEYNVRRGESNGDITQYTGPSGYDALPQFTGFGAADPNYQYFGPGGSAGYIGGSAFKTGGISHLGKRTPMPASLFVGAPHFAQGGLSDGGIPSILHPNEAVIPLQNGGVPVNLNGGNSSRLDPIQARQLQCLYDINQNTMEVRQTIIDMNVLTIDEFKTTQSAIRENTSILTGLRDSADKIPDGISKLNDAVDGLQNTLSSLTSNGSGGGNSLIPGSSNAAANSATQYPTARTLTPASGGFGGTNGDLPESRYYTADDGTVTVKPYVAGFATGSPNAWKDAKGGFQATLHKDEAVIPLPDGRSVPVDLGDAQLGGTTGRELEAYEREMRSQRPRTENAPAQQQTVNVRVNMTINAKDAASFGLSKNQIAQDMAAQMKRALQVVGQKSLTDNPTKRAT